MHRSFFLRILFTLVAVSGPVLLGAQPAEGSWFDGMHFEEYLPQHPRGEGERPRQQPRAWRIPCGIMRLGTANDSPNSVMPLSTIVDLERSTSTIHESFLTSILNKDELATLAVRDDPTKKTYAIPSGSLRLRMGSTKATVLAPALRVITDENLSDPLDQYDKILLRLGMDFVSMYKGRLDIEGAGGLFITVNREDGNNDEDVLIPVWQARSPIITHEDL